MSNKYINTPFKTTPCLRQLKQRLVYVLIKGERVRKFWTSDPDSPMRDLTKAEEKMLQQDSLTTLN